MPHQPTVDASSPASPRSDSAAADDNRFADEELPPQPRLSGAQDWSFMRSPGWVASHLFALTVIVSMIGLGFWQLNRLSERQDTNTVVEARSFGDPVSITDALELSADQRDFLSVTTTGHYLSSELVRVANRSQGGAAGDWVVGVFETDAGEILLVNRGFVARDDITAAADDTALTGWLRASQVKDSSFGGTDTGDTFRVPRLDVELIADRLVADGVVASGEELAVVPEWFQLAEPERDIAAPLAVPGADTVPAPVPLPPIDEGSHLSYALQWFTFSAMGAFVYALILRRKAGELQSFSD